MELVLKEKALSKNDSDKIVDLIGTLNELKELEKQVKEMLLNQMELNGIVKIENDKLLISYIGATTRETFDSKKLREDDPNLYDEYVKISDVKPSVRIKLK